MIKKTEFRIGNLFQDEEGVFPITKAFFQLLDFNIKDTNPIPLTEEWLLKFGFEKIIYDCEEVGYGVEYDLKTKHFYLSYCDDFSISISGRKEYRGMAPNIELFRYVHQLQNLYFSLSGEELTVK